MKLPRVKKGQRPLASDFNALAEAIERAHKISVAAPLTMHRGQEGIVIGISLPPGITWFELTETLAPGESAKAKRLRYNADDEDYEIPDGEPEVDVFDPFGTVTGEVGDRMPCIWRNGRWELINIGCTPE